MHSSAAGDFDVCMYKRAAITFSVQQSSPFRQLFQSSGCSGRFYLLIGRVVIDCCTPPVLSDFGEQALRGEKRERGNCAPQIGPFGSGTLTCAVLSGLETLLQFRPTAERRDLLKAHNSL